MNKEIVQQTEAFSYPSVMHGLDMETYKAINALNSHGAATLMDVSPYHFNYERENPKPQTEPMKLGTLVHDLILEPEKIEYRVLPAGANKKTNAGKRLLVGSYCDWLEMDPPPSEQKAEGKILDEQISILEAAFAKNKFYAVKKDELEAGKQIRENLFSNVKIAKDLFADGHAEVTTLWEDASHECRKKARIDWLPEAHEIILDLKTIDRASYDNCCRSILRFGYDFQAAFYREGARATGLGDRVFVVLFVETEPPFQARMFHFLREDLDKAMPKLNRAAARYAEAMRTGSWASYPDTIEPMPMPKYRY